MLGANFRPNDVVVQQPCVEKNPEIVHILVTAAVVAALAVAIYFSLEKGFDMLDTTSGSFDQLKGAVVVYVGSTMALAALINICLCAYNTVLNTKEEAARDLPSYLKYQAAGTILAPIVAPFLAVYLLATGARSRS